MGCLNLSMNNNVRKLHSGIALNEINCKTFETTIIFLCGIIFLMKVFCLGSFPEAYRREGGGGTEGYAIAPPPPPPVKKKERGTGTVPLYHQK